MEGSLGPQDLSKKRLLVMMDYVKVSVWTGRLELRPELQRLH